MEDKKMLSEVIKELQKQLDENGDQMVDIYTSESEDSEREMMLDELRDEIEKTLKRNKEALEENARAIAESRAATSRVKHRGIMVTTVQAFTSFIGIVCIASRFMGIEHMISNVQLGVALLASLVLAIGISQYN